MLTNANWERPSVLLSQRALTHGDHIPAFRTTMTVSFPILSSTRYFCESNAVTQLAVNQSESKYDGVAVVDSW